MYTNCIASVSIQYWRDNMRNKNGEKILVIVYTGLAIAMVTLATAIIKIPAPANGYVNFGDIFIFVTAAIIGKRTALIAGGVGSAISDILSPYAVYAPGTLVIKGIEGLICALIFRRNKNGKIKVITLIIGAFTGAAWMVLGYFLYDYFMFGYATAAADILSNIIQGTVSAAAVVPIVMALSKTGLSINLEK